MLRRGDLVAFPTETVYGLGADATNDQAVASIFAAKDRPSLNPLIAHVPDVAAVAALCDIPPQAAALASAFWPGALTLVLPLRANSGISQLVTAGGNLLAVRVPDAPIAQSILHAAGRPIAAPSANPSGRISPTSAEHVMAGLSGRIDAVIDGGPCPIGVESTIIGFADGPQLLRAGGVPAEAIEACLGETLAPAPTTETPIAPGQLASHYAPGAAVRLNAVEADNEEFHIGFGEVEGKISLSSTGDMVEAAANLFRLLHQADQSGKPIAVTPIPNRGLGRAINDRLRRAAAPRG
ncbi:MAG: threonylcarbamoyl-AMP synthase [Boseongicola sp.]|nr:MAG: threonylcarbamoyl-AMP synthase [Boseongicola sp.]